MTITDFLLARIAEDEARARDVRDPQLRHIVWSIEAGTTVEDHVLAECEAKRRIVEMGCFSDSPESAVDYWLDEGKGLTPSPGLGAMIDVFRLLAFSYADHADYREEWQQ